MATPNKLKATHVKAEAIALLAMGERQDTVASQFDVHPSSISLLATKYKPQIDMLALVIMQDAIEPIKVINNNMFAMAQKLTSNLAVGKPGVKGLLKRMAEHSVTTKDILTLVDRREYRSFEMMGITASHTPGTRLNFLFQNIQGQGNTWRDMQEYGQFLAWKREADVQDGEIVEDEPSGDNAAT